MAKWIFRTVSTLVLLVGAFVPVLAQEKINLAPFNFSGVSADQQMANWNRLVKYKFWGTHGVTFNKEDLEIRETSGYTGSADANITFNNGYHILGGPIISGKDFVISYPGMTPNNDSLFKGPVRAGVLVLPSWYAPSNVFYEGSYCFDGGNIFMDDGNDDSRKKFKAAVNASGGKVYANFNDQFRDEPFSKCPEDVPQPDRNLTVPSVASPSSWEPGIDMTSNYEQIGYIQVPPVESDKDSTWFNKFIQFIEIKGHEGKKLYVLMPSIKHNKNENPKNGRLTRVFLNGELKVDASANDVRIEVVYVNADAKWNKTTQSWDDFDLSKSTIVKNTEYAGNLLFYTTKDIVWGPMVNPNFQGTYMTTGKFTINDHINMAGQLIANELWFESKVKGDFHYVPFNPPEIDVSVFMGKDYKEGAGITKLNINLSSKPETEVSFKYCYEFFGDKSAEDQEKYADYKPFATKEDLKIDPSITVDMHEYMPLCKDNQWKTVSIPKGEVNPVDNKQAAWINLLDDDIVEGNEYMIVRIKDLNGAVIAGNYFDGGLPLRIIDADNEPPKIDSKSSLIMAEETPNAKAGKVNITNNDKRKGRKTTFELLDGDYTDIFGINATTGEVFLKESAKPLDYETWCKDATCSTHQPEYKIKVKACDAEALTVCSQATLEVLVKDINENPIVKDTTVNVPETLKGGSVVARIPSDDIDISVGFRNNKMEAIGGDVDVFSISEKGVLTLKPTASLDFETKNEYSLTVRVSDVNYMNLYDDAVITIKVDDIEDGPWFAEAPEGFVYENSKVGVAVDTVQAECDDKTKKLTYSLEDPTETFTIDPNTGIVTVAKPTLDYEVQQTYYVTVVVTDNGLNPQNATTQLTIHVIDVNEPPIFLGDSATFEENLPKGEIITTLTGDDFDIEEKFCNNKFILVGGDTEGFRLSETGVLTTDKVFDFEKDKTEYILKVAFQDRDDPSLEMTNDLVVTLTNVNEPPYITKTKFNVDENSEGGTLIGVITGADPDKDSHLTFTVPDGAGNLPFTVLGDGSIVVRDGAEIDYETKTSYDFKVRVTDDGGLYSDTVVTVKVNDIVERVDVVITRAENKDSVWLNPDTLYVNLNDITIEWTVDGELNSSEATLKDGPNVIVKEYCDDKKNACGRDTLVVYVSTAAPIVTVSADKKKGKAEDIYTIVESVDEKDSSVYVNKRKTEINVTVKDKSTELSDSFTIDVEVDDVSVPSSMLKTIKSIADAKASLDTKADVHRTPENDDRIKMTYNDRVNGKDVVVTYYTDKKGNVLKTPVVVDGKTKEVKTIMVSYTEKVDDKDVTVSFLADASTGKRVDLASGVIGDNSKSVVGDFTVSYGYKDKSGHNMNIAYTMDDKGRIVANSEGNTGYNVSYTYTNKYGNSATRSVFVVLDQKGPKVEILTPSDNDVIYGSFTDVVWTVNGEKQDSLNVQSLDNGFTDIIRTYIDKAGNVSTAKITVLVKKAKNIEISVEKPVTVVDADSVAKYYDAHPPKEGDRYVISVFNAKKDREEEVIIGGKDGERDGKHKVPYDGLEGHLGPTLGFDVRLPQVNSVGGLATLDDIVGKDGMVAIDGVDAADSRKVTVDEYVRHYCNDEFAEHRDSDNGKMNLYDVNVDVDVWVYTSLGGYVDRFTFKQTMNDPDYINGAGLAKMFFEMKPDLDGNIRTSDGRLVGTGAYIYKTEVNMVSKLRCTLPPVGDMTKPGNDVRNRLKSSDELLKSFGYKRPQKK